ncbi:DUF3592 domain-containing protein [Amphiplicatus metriothermophilus]|uniref:DUF3592 domain-containing protein n=1 Tax=Amphiplicatus metriothermophilus TaxID=1519374 RepID=A0A239PQJ1_9PROT|nr:DUF3592 domain-containing protein [Amphiplicatus metriothermophilus]MBB5518428.1 hypothetical protein [Amphiplicatus metriothermophilus]SNT72410.1 Protein of unknown function [Amphiplicatus metriothermophilus]
MSDDAKYRAELLLAAGFFVILAVSGVLLAGFGVRDFAFARASLSWPTVEAVMLSAPDGEGVRYAYSVAGRKYESRRARFFTASFQRAAGIDARPGDVVPAAYDPARPSRSVLEPGGAGSVFFATVAAGALLTFLGLGGIVRLLSEAAVLDEQTASGGAQVVYE